MQTPDDTPFIFILPVSHYKHDLQNKAHLDHTSLWTLQTVQYSPKKADTSDKYN